MKNRRIKIPGVTSGPLFLTQWRGYFDAKRGAVLEREGNWYSHYIEKKEAALARFQQTIYAELESSTSALQSESATLSIEYYTLKDKHIGPACDEGGRKPSARIRSHARKMSARANAENRATEIPMRLAEIEQSIKNYVNAQAILYLEAEAIMEKRIQAYLLGASLANHKVSDTVKYPFRRDFDLEDDYYKRHKNNAAVREEIRKACLGGEI